MSEKVEGAKMTCMSCDTELVCHMSTYEGGFENKLQWQNSDGTAHYKWKSAGKYDCVIPNDDEVQDVSSSSTTTIVTKSTIDIPEPDAITSSHIDKELILISQIEKKVIAHLGVSVVPAKIGLYVKLIYEGIVKR